MPANLEFTLNNTGNDFATLAITSGAATIVDSNALSLTALSSAPNQAVSVTAGGALTLPNLLTAEAQSGSRSSHRAVINVYLGGGPPHQDTWELKPDAPTEITATRISARDFRSGASSMAS